MTEQEGVVARVSQQDILDLLREYTAAGYAVHFPLLTARITDADVEDEARRDALTAVAREKLAATIARGHFVDLTGVGGFFERLGVAGLAFTDDVVDTVAEFNDRVGDGVFTVERSLYDGKTSDGLTAAQERERMLRSVLERAGYTPEEIPGKLPQFAAYRHMIQVMRRPDQDDPNHRAFFRNVVPLFSERQRVSLRITDGAAAPRQLPSAGRPQITGR